MAYKSKSYRKFLATGTTAALVASAIVPAASAADHPFTDVNTNYDEAVSYLFNNDITKGYTETTFGTYMSLTRGNAAVIIANALELDTTSAPDAGFEDVNSRVAGSVNALVEAGIMDGFSDTEFRPDVELSRGAMAKILVNAYGLENQAMDTPFTDLTSTFGSYIEALYGAGITTGKTETTFGTNQEILRGEFAVLLYKSINYIPTPEVSTVKSSSSTEFTVNFEEAVEEGVEVEDLMLDVVVVLDNGTEVTPEVTGAKLSADRKSVTIMHKNNDLNGLKGQIIVNGVDGEFDYSQPKVASVMAASGKELVINFNQAVDKTDAEDLTNYSLTGETFTGTPVVSKDGKTVTLTATDVIDVTNATLQIDPIKTKADAKVSTEKYVTLFTFKDTAAPTVATVEAKGTEAVITFTEELATEGTVSLNGSKITDYVVSGKTLTIKNLVAEKSYKLDVVGATDAAGNMAGQTTVNFTVEKPVVDSSKPTVASSVSGNMLTLTFSEEVTPGTVTIGGETVESDKLVASEDKMTYTVDVQDAKFFSGVTFFTKEVVVSGFTDGSNTMEAAKFNATFTADTTAPEFISSSIKTLGKDTTSEQVEDVLLLTFDDAVKQGDLSASAELVVKSIDGIYQSDTSLNLSTANVSYGYDLDGKDGIKGNELNVVAIKMNTTEKSSYSFELAGKVVADVYGNQVADTVTFSAVAPEYSTTPSTDAKDVKLNSAPVVTNNKNIELNFNKSMSDSAVNSSNYMLGGKALPAGTTVKFVDNRSKVVITLPQGSVTANGTYALVGTNLTDQNGNTLEGGKVNANLTLKENIVPTASKITLADSKTFMVDFSESVSSASVTGVTVKVNNVALASGKYTLTVENGDLKVVTTDNLKTTDSLTVEFKNTNLVDANGNAVANSSISK